MFEEELGALRFSAQADAFLNAMEKIGEDFPETAEAIIGALQLHADLLDSISGYIRTVTDAL